MSSQQQDFLDLVYAISRIPLFAFWGCIVACGVGSLIGGLSVHGVLLFVSRMRSFRRFRSADARRYSIARHASSRVVLTLARTDAELLLRFFRYEAVPDRDGDRVAAAVHAQCARWGVQ